MCVECMQIDRYAAFIVCRYAQIKTHTHIVKQYTLRRSAAQRSHAALKAHTDTDTHEKMRDNNNNNTAATSTVSMISAVQEEWIRLNKEMSGKLATFTPIIDGLLDSFKSQPELFDSSKVFARF